MPQSAQKIELEETHPSSDQTLSQTPLRQEESDEKDFRKVGQLFFDARQSKNLSIKTIADKIHVRSLYLEAIEKGDFDKLPSSLYASGFIKLYARFLHLDGDEILRRIHFKEPESFCAGKMVSISTAVHPPRTAYFVSIGLITITFLIMGLILFFPKMQTASVNIEEAILQVPKPAAVIEAEKQEPKSPSTALANFSTQTNPSSETSTQYTSLPTTTTNTPATIEKITTIPQEAPITSQDQQVALPTHKDGSLTFHALQDCWMEIDRKGVIVFSRILKKGESFTIDSPKEHRISVGNALGLDIVYNGKPYSKLSTTERVIKNVSLDSFIKVE